jgi:hypothetical protein
MLKQSPKVTARIAGAVYLLNGAFGPGLMALGKIYVAGDAAKTATNLIAHETLFRVGFAGNMIATASYIVVTALFYQLFRPVNKTVSLMAAFFSLVGCAVLAVSCAVYLSPLAVLGGAHGPIAPTAEAQLLALTLLKLYGQCFNASLVFFGFYCMSIGYLIVKSTFLPRLLGYALMVGGTAWLVFLAPTFARSIFPYLLILDAGEGALVLWLLVFGVNSARWNEQAAAARLAA